MARKGITFSDLTDRLNKINTELENENFALNTWKKIVLIASMLASSITAYANGIKDRLSNIENPTEKQVVYAIENQAKSTILDAARKGDLTINNDGTVTLGDNTMSFGDLVEMVAKIECKKYDGKMNRVINDIANGEATLAGYKRITRNI